jgi:two-component system NtrC family sensor kinase
VAEVSGQIDLSTDYDSRRQQVLFHCRDNGPGIDPDIQKDVFKPFFTTKPVGEGTGLGLYICHEIISRHNGTIEVAPLYNKGTRVSVRLPAYTSR